MKTELWKTIYDHPDYMVSSHGRVTNIETGRLLRPFENDSGHLRVRLKDRKGHQVHRLVLAAFFVGPYLEKWETRHRNGDPARNWIENLLPGTQADNMKDRSRHGGHRRMTMDQRCSIQNDLADMSITDVVRKHNRPLATIRSIKKGMTPLELA